MTPFYNYRSFSVVIQACLVYLATAIATQATKAAPGLSRSHVWHRGDEWANWGLTANNSERWDKCWAPLSANVCSIFFFFLVVLSPVSHLPCLCLSLPGKLILSFSLCRIPLPALKPLLFSLSLSGWFSSACISCKCRSKWLWQHSQMFQLPQIYWVIKVMYCD